MLKLVVGALGACILAAASASAADWATACVWPNGTITGTNPGHSRPKGACRGKIVRFVAEQPGVRPINRAVFITSPNDGRPIFRAEPFLIDVIWVTRSFEDSEFRLRADPGVGGVCGIFLTPAGWNVELSRPIPSTDTLATEGSTFVLVSARPNKTVTVFEPNELVSTDGRALRILEMSVTLNDRGCFGGAVMLYSPRGVPAFYGMR